MALGDLLRPGPIDPALALQAPAPNEADLLEALSIGRGETTYCPERRHIVALALALFWVNLEAEACTELARQFTTTRKDT